MGGVCGKEADAAPPQRMHPQQVKQVKVLLLGSGESGKSTFFKQIQIIHHSGFKDAELEQFKSSIYANIIHSMKSMIEHIERRKLQFENSDNYERGKRILALADQDATLLLQATEKYTMDVAADIEALWADATIKQVFQYRSEYHVFDGAKYFFDDLPRLRPPSYMPTAEDVLRCRRKTSGIIQTQFEYSGLKFTLVDVGGQRNERRKWLNAFAGVTALIYVAALSDYDQTCYEDDITNRMMESLDLFDETCNNTDFCNKPVMLFLNKTDLFREKLAKTDLSILFRDYTFGNDPERAMKFVEEKFLNRNKFDRSRIYTHFTCATDTHTVDKAFKTVCEHLLQNDQQPI